MGTAPTPGEALRRALESAILAPSSHNTQPWRFALDGDRVELRADRSRRLPVVDPEGRELVISCGAALLTLRVALRSLGWAGVVDVLPGDGDADLLARVGAGGRRPPTGEDEALAAAVAERRTNRAPFEERPLPPPLVEALAAAARDEGAVLALPAGAGRERLVELVARGDRIQFADRRFRRELAAWTRSNASPARDGIRGDALGIRNLASHALPLVIRAVDAGARQARRDARLAQGSGALAVVCTADDTPAAWLAAGQALGRILLVATRAGVAASFLNQPVEVPELRPHIARAVARPDLTPQILLRLGRPTRSFPAQTRRPVDEVLDPSG
ncbi:MAG: nitroreductase family protein [Actinomycetota bacterium]